MRGNKKNAHWNVQHCDYFLKTNDKFIHDIYHDMLLEIIELSY